MMEKENYSPPNSQAEAEGHICKTYFVCLNCGHEFTSTDKKRIPDYCPNCSPQFLPPVPPENLKEINFDAVSQISLSVSDESIYPVVIVRYIIRYEELEFIHRCTARQDYGLSWLVVELAEREWPSHARFSPGQTNIVYVGPKHPSWNEHKNSLRDRISSLTVAISDSETIKNDPQTASDLKNTYTQIMHNARLTTWELRQVINDLKAMKAEEEEVSFA